MNPKALPAPASVVRAAFDQLVERTRAVAAVGGRAGGEAVASLPPSVGHLLTSLRHVADQVPSVDEELSIIVQEIHAKRLSIQALQAELSVLDGQLEVLERALAPWQAWAEGWGRLREILAGHPGAAADVEGPERS